MRFGYLIFKQFSITVKEPNKITVVNIPSAHQKTDSTPNKEGTISPKTNSPNFNNNQLTMKDRYYTANAPKRKFGINSEENTAEPVNKMCKQIDISEDINENFNSVKLPEIKSDDRVVDFEEEMEEEEDYSKYEQDIEEITDDDASDRLRISVASEDDSMGHNSNNSPDRKLPDEKMETDNPYYFTDEHKPKKKSKKEKRHHHHHHRHHDRKKSLEATILQSDDANDLKLKVKLNVSKSSYHSHKKSKNSDASSSPKQLPSDDDSNSTKSSKSEETRNSRERKPVTSPVPNIQNGYNSAGEEKANIPASTKEKLLQMRAVRHKPFSKEPKQTSEERTALLLAQSSITVSKITQLEKIQLERNKLHLTNNALPSLEIMLVKGPTPKSVSELNKPGNVNAGLDLQRVSNGTSNNLLSKINKISSDLKSETHSAKVSPVKQTSQTVKEKSMDEKSAEREAKLLDYVGALDLSRRPPNMPISNVTSSTHEKLLGSVQKGTWAQKQMNGKKPSSTPIPTHKPDVLKNKVNPKTVSHPVNKPTLPTDLKNNSPNNIMKKVQSSNTYLKKPSQPSYVPYYSSSGNGEKPIITQPLKIPPTSNIPNTFITNKNVPKLNNPVSHIPPNRRNGIPMNLNSTKPGMNQAVRQIPNPSALLSRNQVPNSVPTNTVEKKFKSGIPPMPAAIPISALTSLKRIESIGKAFEKGAHSLLKSKAEF